MVKVMKITSFDPNHITCSQIKRNQNGAKRIDFSYTDPKLKGDFYLIQPPKCRLPFGLTENQNESRQTSYSLQLSFDNFKSGYEPEVEFIRHIEKIDEYIKQLAVQKSKEWFGKSMKMELMNELYHPSIKFSDDWAPLFKMKLPYYNDQFDTLFFDNDKRQINPIESIKRGSQVIAVFQLSSMWFMGSKFGVVWTCKQCQVFSQANYNTFMIQDDKDEDMENVKDEYDEDDINNDDM
jgi:hypothetical protein